MVTALKFVCAVVVVSQAPEAASSSNCCCRNGDSHDVDGTPCAEKIGGSGGGDYDDKSLPAQVEQTPR